MPRAGQRQYPPAANGPHPAPGRAPDARRGDRRSPEADDVLDRIGPVVERDDGVTLLVYGDAKTGKTRLCATFPKPVLIVGTEDGTRSVVGVKGVQFVRIRSTAEFERLRDVKAREFRTVALDHGGGLLRIVEKEIKGLANVPVTRAWGDTDQQVWGAINNRFMELVAPLLELADTDGVNVVSVAHERTVHAKGDVGQTRIGPALSPQTMAFMNAAHNYICQTFKRNVVERREEVTELEGGQKETTVIEIPTGEVEYALRVGPSSTFITGFRLPMGRDALPEAIVNPTYDKILKLIKGDPR
jgi:hypothetical protein